MSIVTGWCSGDGLATSPYAVWSLSWLIEGCRSTTTRRDGSASDLFKTIFCLAARLATISLGDVGMRQPLAMIHESVGKSVPKDPGKTGTTSSAVDTR